jgi:peptidoglycan hydrolase-like protein with peptidoglycan-binding domain
MALVRELSLRLPLQRGDDVRAVQQALIRTGMLTGSADGIFGPATHRAVLDFQRRMQARHPSFAADGIIGRQSWSALFPDAAPHPLMGAATPEAGLAAVPDWRAMLRPYVQRLMAGSAPPVGQGARRWRLSPEGLRVEGYVAPPRSAGRPETVTRCWRDFRTAFETCAAAYGVPVELLIATACTESGGRAGAIREEPGFVSDAATPHRVSPGLMQTLISTAQGSKVGVIEDVVVTNDWRGKGVANFLGEDVPEGTYYYIVEGTDFNGGVVRLAGPLTIKR